MPASPRTDLKKILQNRTPDSQNFLPQNEYLPTLAAAFLLDRKAQNLTRKTLEFYRANLQKFIEWCDTQAVKTVTDLSPELLRGFFIAMSETHKAGGVHAYYRAVRVFLRWYAAEFDSEGWRDPLRKVRPPKVDVEPLAPVPLEHVRAMLDTCERGKFTDERDAAIILFLLDTGARAGELLALDRDDADILTGEVLIRKSKSRKPRTVFLGRKARRALRSYLKLRGMDTVRAVFVTREIERLKMSGLRQIMVRRARRANVPIPSLHSFRRACALALHRAGIDLLSIARLLGHSDISLLQRYIRQDAEDLRGAHERGSPADTMI
jgi:site-specific recombinase XerD